MKEKNYVNGSFIKSIFQERNPIVEDLEEPFGLIIAT